MRMMPYKTCSGQRRHKREKPSDGTSADTRKNTHWLNLVCTNPSFAFTAVKIWPCTFAMLWSFHCFWPACREQMTSWMLSHPRTDLWATMVSGSVFRFRVTGELPFDVQMHTHTLLIQTNYPYTHFLCCLDPTLAYYCSRKNKHKYLPWSESCSTSGNFISLWLCPTWMCVIFPMLSFYSHVLFS